MLFETGSLCYEAKAVQELTMWTKLALNLQVLGLKADTMPDQNSSIFLLSNNCDPSSVPSRLT